MRAGLLTHAFRSAGRSSRTLVIAYCTGRRAVRLSTTRQGQTDVLCCMIRNVLRRAADSLTDQIISGPDRLQIGTENERVIWRPTWWYLVSHSIGADAWKGSWTVTTSSSLAVCHAIYDVCILCGGYLSIVWQRRKEEIYGKHHPK